MKSLRLVIGLCALLASCREKPAPLQNKPTPAPTAAPVAATAPALVTRATPEQLGSVLRLRVAFGGLPPRDTTAALLHHDEVPDPSVNQGNSRFVLASLKGWEESQLRGYGARLIVYRREVNLQGDTDTVSFPASLVQFDRATGLGIVTYVDTFAYPADVGFHLQREADLAHADLMLLRTLQTNGGAVPPGPVPGGGGREDKRFTVDAGTYHGDKAGVRVDLPALGPQDRPDTTTLAASTPDRLYGFVEITPAGPVVTGLKGFKVSALPIAYEVAQVMFDNPSMQDHYRINLTVAAVAGASPPRQLRLHMREAAAADQDKLPPPEASGPFPPVSIEKAALVQRFGLSGVWSVNLPDPAMDQEKFFLMQISWPLLSEQGAPEVYGRPFMVKVSRRPEGIFPVLLDQVPAKGGPAADLFGDAKRFPLEGTALDVHLAAGGREALLHLDAPPYWKRFSFEKNQWLPLPPGNDLAKVSVTGNLSALFVLDPVAREVRKYQLPELEPAGTMTLPPGNYLTILAGCNSAHAPVHLVVGTDMMSLDPETLKRCDTPLEETERQRRGNGLAVGTGPFFITGNGLGVRRIDRNVVQILNYNGDGRGFEFNYFDLPQRDNQNQVPGVTAGFFINDGLRCVDTPGGKSVDQGRPSVPWNFAPSALAENAPVIFRILRPQSGELAPKPRLGCFAFPSASPFAELEAPELGGVTDYDAWTQHRWAFLDPYTRQLATLGSDRRTWFVRKLALGGERRQPVLLNWPDTTVPKGGKMVFHPVIAGGTEFGAEMTGADTGLVVEEAKGTVSWSIAPDAFASLQLLNLRVPGQDGAQAIYPILLHPGGTQLPFGAPPDFKPDGLNWRGAGLGSLGMSEEGFYPLKAATYPLTNPAAEVLGPVAGCAVLITEARRLDFFSLEARQVVSSTVGPVGAFYYVGAGALLEYDPGKRTLTRIRIPDGIREQVLALPGNTTLSGIGVGADPSSPITVAVTNTRAERIDRFADLLVTTKLLNEKIAVLDGRSLKAGNRAQPVNFGELLGRTKEDSVGENLSSLLNFPDQAPAVLPASRDGSLVYLRQHFLALGPNYAVGYPCGLEGSFVDLNGSNSSLASGSLSGLMSFTRTGAAYKGGIEVKQHLPIGGISPQQLGASADGLYQFSSVIFGPTNRGVEVSAAENDRPLLQLGRLGFVDDILEGGTNVRLRHLLMLGDHGPLAVLNGSGRTLKLVDLDVATAARRVQPNDFHVVSQPVPFVMEGRTFRYQVQVNNPDAVQSMVLQNSFPGVSMSTTGAVSYLAPNNITAPTHATISIEIKGRNGQTLLHEFPVYVLPWPRAGMKTKTGEI